MTLKMCNKCKKRPAASAKGRCKECLSQHKQQTNQKYLEPIGTLKENYLAIQIHGYRWKVWTAIGKPNRAGYRKVEQLRQLANEQGLTVYYFGSEDIKHNRPQELQFGVSLPTY